MIKHEKIQRNLYRYRYIYLSFSLKKKKGKIICVLMSNGKSLTLNFAKIKSAK